MAQKTVYKNENRKNCILQKWEKRLRKNGRCRFARGSAVRLFAVPPEKMRARKELAKTEMGTVLHASLLNPSKCIEK